MHKKSTSSTARIEEGAYCKDCGWPIVFACCNDEMAELHNYEDWWMYCANQGCRNHIGEAFNQGDWPSFLAYDGEQ